MGVITIHGPQTCPRPCADCNPGHHWLPVCLDLSEFADPLDSEDYEAVLAFDREHGTEHALAFYACKHCPAWISDDDFDLLLEGEGAA